MGGFGSGRRWHYSAKETADGLRSLDINWLVRSHFIQPAKWGPVKWSRNGEPTGSIHVACLSRQELILSYNHSSGGSEAVAVEQRVSLDWTPCRFGGERAWFRCPGVRCGGKRVSKLYAGGRLFLCRTCYDLAYQSQRDDAANRALSQTQDIRKRLGGSYSLADSFPAKPKGMHWRTYERLRNRAAQLEGVSLSAMMARVDSMRRTLSAS